MRNRLIFSFAAVVLFAALYLTSCKKKEEELGPIRQFTTAGKISITAGETSAVISWREAINTDSVSSNYTVEIAKDSTFASGAEFTYKTPGTSLTVTDTQLTIREKYYVRVRTNGATPSLDSKWAYSSKFSLSGEQIFQAVKESETKHNSVILHWRDTTGATLVKIVLTPDGGVPTDYLLDPIDVDSSFKKIEGLLPATKYHAQIFSTTKEKGFTDFTTKDLPVYAYTINSGMDLVKVLDTCAPSIIIGLDTGTYLPTGTYSIKSKSITLMSVSGNPDDTKITFNEFKIMGDGAGLNLKDVTCQGSATALYFLNLAGLASDAAAASFANITLENCRVTNYGNCFMRANRGTAAGDHKIGAIKVNNCIVSNNLLTNLYTEFTVDKLAFETLSITNSTFFNVGRAMILMSTVLPTSAAIPVVLFDKNTMNNWGTGSTRVFMDANANPVKATISNSIFANTPRTGTVSNDFIRASAATTTLVFTNNNFFKLMNGSAAALTMPAGATGSNQIDLGWLPATVEFKLPAGSPLQTASTSGGPIGDPRWN